MKKAQKAGRTPQTPLGISPEDYNRLMTLAAAEGSDPQATLHRLLAEATPSVDTRVTLQLSFIGTTAAARAALADLRRRHWAYKPDVGLDHVGHAVLDTVLGFPEWVSARLDETAYYTEAEGVPFHEFNVSRILAALAARNAAGRRERP